MNVVRFLLLSFTMLFAGNAYAELLPLRVLIVLSNTAQVPGSDRPTGVWASEYTDPYEIFTKAGYEVHVASPKGGKSSVDPRSGSEDRVRRIPSAWQKMQNTQPLAELRVMS